MDSVQPRDQPTREWGEQAYMRTRKWIQVVVISNLVIVIWCMWIAWSVSQWQYPLPHGRLLAPATDGEDDRAPWEPVDLGGSDGSLWGVMDPGYHLCPPMIFPRDRIPPNPRGIGDGRPAVGSLRCLWLGRWFRWCRLRGEEVSQVLWKEGEEG